MPIQVIMTNAPDVQTATITFEGGGDRQPIGTVNAGFTNAIFDSAWVTLRSTQAPVNPGTSNVINEPSPFTVASFLTPDGVVATHSIAFTQPISDVSLFYSSMQGPVTLRAFDSNGNLLGTAVGPQNNPSQTQFNTFDQIALAFPSNVISAITITATANRFVIDNLELSLITPVGLGLISVLNTTANEENSLAAALQAAANAINQFVSNGTPGFNDVIALNSNVEQTIRTLANTSMLLETTLQNALAGLTNVGTLALNTILGGILASIANEEQALGNLINAEANKTNFVAANFPANRTALTGVDNSASAMLRTITNYESALQTKSQLLLNFIRNNSF